MSRRSASHRSIEEINRRIAAGKVVVVTAEEMTAIVAEEGPEKAFRRVDVVTTGTFGMMCSSGALLNLGHTRPRIKLSRAWLNGVPAYCGLAAVDLYLGAAELAEDDPANKVYPGEFDYGGGHVIEDLVAGRRVHLRAEAYGTDCYPARGLEGHLRLQDLNNAWLLNPRNAYQNYNVAVNSSDRTIYTYMGMLLPRLGNANYSSAGSLSPLLNDPFFKTIGVGTRIFLGGGVGHVIWYGTQHNPAVERTAAGLPVGGAGTLAVLGDLKQMSPDFLRGASVTGYGVSLAVGLGIPIPVLSPEIARYTGVGDEDILAPVVDYGRDYPNREPRVLGTVSYAELRSGRIRLEGKEVPTGSLSSLPKAREVAETLKEWIAKGRFYLTRPAFNLPAEGPEAPVARQCEIRART